ncbi:hypothetical protein AB0K05_27025 [Nonomuraea sp. NPDC049486]|uniref:hypothetical protein n=1 Tax=Nonomuraea sp. NPDC049486 TaxID=3155773 RepID=UPI00344742BD
MLADLHGSTQLAVNAITDTVSRELYLPFGERRGSDDLPFTQPLWILFSSHRLQR